MKKAPFGSCAYPELNLVESGLATGLDEVCGSVDRSGAGCISKLRAVVDGCGPSPGRDRRRFGSEACRVGGWRWGQNEVRPPGVLTDEEARLPARLPGRAHRPARRCGY